MPVCWSHYWIAVELKKKVWESKSQLASGDFDSLRMRTTSSSVDIHQKTKNNCAGEGMDPLDTEDETFGRTVRLCNAVPINNEPLLSNKLNSVFIDPLTNQHTK